MFKGKKGLEVFGFWVEIFFVILIITGAFVGFAIKNAALSYVAIFICSFITASILYAKRHGGMGLYIFLTLGFASSYIIANRSANPLMLFMVFITGNYINYSIFKNKLIKLL
ncbi:hypothetical protein HYU11_01215 [Candidatus Woesearchaeota archaeon]|nr:hypothetical protein [Candidatus Woesearchaeota archaeon]